MGQGSIRAFLQHRPILNLHVEQVDFLVSVDNLAALVNPNNRVLHPLGIEAGFVDADVNGQLLAAGFLAQAQDELAVVDGSDKTDGFLAGAGNVVASLGEKESLELTLSPVLGARKG